MLKDNRRKNARIDDEMHYQFLERGVLSIDREITPKYTAIVNRDLMFMHHHLASGENPIWLILNSPGGDVYQGFALHDTIKALVTSGRIVKIVGVGHVASIATVIMQAGTARLSLPNTQFLIHQIRDLKIFSEEEVNEAEENTAELKRINQIVIGIIAKRTGMDLQKILEKTRKKNYWLDPEEAKKFGRYGLIDEVITSLAF